MNRIEVSNLEFIKMEPRGKAVEEKFWVYKDNIKKLVKASSFGIDQDIMEYISYRILKEINIDTVEIELGYDSISKKNCCLVSNFLKSESEESYQVTNWKKVIINHDEEEEIRLSFDQVFKCYSSLYEISNNELEQLKRDYIRIILGKCITENSDSKLENIDLIFNIDTKKYRLSPSYDNGFSFNEYNSICKPKCCVGNQFFDMESIVLFIINNFLEYVRDIPEMLQKFVDESLSQLIMDIGDETIEQKKLYIYDYLIEINEMIQKLVNEKRIK